MNKERYLKNYIDFCYGDEQHDEMYAPDVHQTRKDFTAGWDTLRNSLNSWIRNEIKDLKKEREVFSESKIFIDEGAVINGKMIALKDLLQKITSQ